MESQPKSWSKVVMSLGRINSNRVKEMTISRLEFWSKKVMSPGRNKFDQSERNDHKSTGVLVEKYYVSWSNLVREMTIT